MGKIAPVSAKYIIHSSIHIEGVVDRPDVIGAIFGQTEGLLGTDLELRELQRSGRIGRIEVELESKKGKTNGTILIPSSLDKAETSIIGAAMEIIERIGPCNAKIQVQKIEDVRISKRQQVVDRAKELLKKMMEGVIPDSQELADEVAQSVRVMEITEFGKDRLPAGPGVEDNDEILIVEGRADVLNLLKYGIKNAIAMNGTSVPQTIIDLSKEKIVTVFVDGDRGGDLNIQELMQVADIDFVTKAPDGKEVEEITKKEIHKSLRSKITIEQAKLEFANKKPAHKIRSSDVKNTKNRDSKFQKPKPFIKKNNNLVSDEEKVKFKEILDNLVGTRGAYVLDKELKILGKVPFTELTSTIKNLKSSGVYAILFDGDIDQNLMTTAEKVNIKYVVGMNIKGKISSKATYLTMDKLNN